MSTYRFLGLILAQTEEEFIYFYSLGSGSGARKLGMGLWNAMYRYGQSEEAKEKHRAKVREYMRRKKQEQGQ